jgi:hypothetical protein
VSRVVAESFDIAYSYGGIYYAAWIHIGLVTEGATTPWAWATLPGLNARTFTWNGLAAWWRTWDRAHSARGDVLLGITSERRDNVPMCRVCECSLYSPARKLSCRSHVRRREEVGI